MFELLHPVGDFSGRNKNGGSRFVDRLRIAPEVVYTEETLLIFPGIDHEHDSFNAGPFYLPLGSVGSEFHSIPADIEFESLVPSRRQAPRVGFEEASPARLERKTKAYTGFGRVIENINGEFLGARQIIVDLAPEHGVVPAIGNEAHLHAFLAARHMSCGEAHGSVVICAVQRPHPVRLEVLKCVRLGLGLPKAFFIIRSLTIYGHRNHETMQRYRKYDWK